MDMILKSHEYFISEKSDDGSISVTILKDDNKFYGISLVGCKFITNKMGFTNDEFTEDVIIKIKEVRWVVIEILYHTISIDNSIFNHSCLSYNY